MNLPAVTRRAPFWLSLFALWFGTLWVLSSGPVPLKTGPEIPHLDKVAHFGYFFGGAGLLSAFLYRLQKDQADWTKMLTIVLLAMTATGSLMNGTNHGFPSAPATMRKTSARTSSAASLVSGSSAAAAIGSIDNRSRPDKDSHRQTGKNRFHYRSTASS
jgi:hypothetical protein